MPVERINWKKRDRVEPKWRIYSVLRRLSRDRYLTPGEVDDIAHKIRRRTGGTSQSVNFATGGHGGSRSFGMIRGECPIDIHRYRVPLTSEVMTLRALRPNPGSIENELVLSEIIRKIEKWKIKTVLPE